MCVQSVCLSGLSQGSLGAVPVCLTFPNTPQTTPLLLECCQQAGEFLCLGEVPLAQEQGPPCSWVFCQSPACVAAPVTVGVELTEVMTFCPV